MFYYVKSLWSCQKLKTGNKDKPNAYVSMLQSFMLAFRINYHCFSGESCHVCVQYTIICYLPHIIVTIGNNT